MSDLNERLKAGTLPNNPSEGTRELPTSEAELEPGAPRTLGDIRATAIRTIQERKSGGGVIATPWQALNERLGGGLQASNMYIAVGNTGGGKTQWALSLAWEAAKAGKRVQYVALESDETEIYCRLVALENPGTVWSKLYQGGGERELTELPDCHFLATFPAPGRWTPRDLPGEGIDLVVLDYLQLAGSSGQDERLAMKQAAYDCRDYARRTGTAVLILSSTARQYYAQFQLRGDKVSSSGKDKGQYPSLVKDGVPTIPATMFMGTGKESGDIEYAASAVIILAREAWGEGEEATPVHVAVAKNRMGKTGWPLVLDFNGSCFSEPEQKSPKGSSRQMENA